MITCKNHKQEKNFHLPHKQVKNFHLPHNQLHYYRIYILETQKREKEIYENKMSTYQKAESVL